MTTAEEKKIKSEFKAKAQKEPEKFYPIEVLKENGFRRFKCSKCGSFFWSAVEREICGDPNCSGKYQFIGNSPTKTKLEYLEVWKRFSKTFKKFGYAPIARYPVAARWRDDMDFVIASIADFQPYVVSGEIEPPANPLTIPQFCLRFGDVDNVGITGRHFTGFVMIGQHAFMPPKDYKPRDYISHIFKWLTEEVKIPKTELQFHEDAWAGGGNMGPSIEFFSRGLELGNQVYMQYDIKNGIKELGIKVLDMGMGQERYAWLTNGTNTSYDVVFPSVVKKIFSLNGIKPDAPVWNKFLPYSGMLNLDEADNIEKVWQNIAKDINMDVKELKGKIIPVSAVYSIADHTRSLLLALNDSALPSNVGGGYNLRVILRRSLDFINKYGWDIHLPDLCREHAKYLKPQYPELMENLDDIDEILDFEKKKYAETVVKSKKLVSNLSANQITEEKLIELYDSHGISPDLIAEQLNIKVPEGFYGKVAERHEKAEMESKKAKEGNASSAEAA
ncbi:MAG: alanine--tRNA ligase-related protein [Candidatus Aenigmatarchaeota archaeon]